MSNLMPKVNKFNIEINGNLHFSQMWVGESFETLQVQMWKRKFYRWKYLMRLLSSEFII